MNGLLMYFTNRNTNRKARSFSGLQFKSFAESDSLVNQPFDEAFITVLRFEDTPYFVEHNELLETEEIGKMVGLVAGALFKMQPDYDANGQ